MLRRLVMKPFLWILMLIVKVTIWIRRLWNPDLLILEHVEGFYEIDRSTQPLGSGAYGTVWVGRNVATREEVAVKMVRVNKLTKKFVKRELEFSSKCQHSNIIKFLWSEHKNDCRYFVMEYCINGNLNTFMEAREISFGLCVKFMLNIASAVEYLHKLYISHRDIKPQNILVSEDAGGYFLMLADFGLARYFPASSSAIPASMNTGTFGWMAPETHDNSSLSSRYNKSADVFALGLLFLVLVRHRLGYPLEPFTVHGRFLGTWMGFQHSEGREVRVPDIGDRADKRIELIYSMLAFHPPQRCRISDVCRVLRELPRDEERVTAGESSATSNARPRHLSRRWTRYCTSGCVCALSVLVLMLAVVIGIYLVRNHKPDISDVPCDDIWSRLDINSLERSLHKNLYGQHLAVEAIVQSFWEHTRHSRPKRALVLSFHGSQGVGKSYTSRIIAALLYEEGPKSPFVHLIQSDKIQALNIQSKDLVSWAKSMVIVCSCSFFIFDKAEGLPHNFLIDMKEALKYDFKESIFLFESNFGADAIVDKTVDYYQTGRKREDITLNSMAGFLRTTAQTEVAWDGKRYAFFPGGIGLISAFVPFLPLERRHLLSCIQDAIIEHNVVLSLSGYTRPFAELVADRLYEFTRVESTLFSKLGCHNAWENILQELVYS